MKERKIRVIVAKPGLDGHDRGAKVIARAFRDAGMEVIYTGLRQTPEQIVETAIQEDADAIGVSILSGAHEFYFARIIELLRQKKRTMSSFSGEESSPILMSRNCRVSGFPPYSVPGRRREIASLGF